MNDRPACRAELMDGGEILLEVSKELKTFALLVSATRELSGSINTAQCHL